jgi:hypothetical protein
MMAQKCNELLLNRIYSLSHVNIFILWHPTSDEVQFARKTKKAH